MTLAYFLCRGALSLALIIGNLLHEHIQGEHNGNVRFAGGIGF